MKNSVTGITLLLIAVFLALAPIATASTTWYVNGVSGSDNNNCTSPLTACKTIGHAISLAASGDLIKVAAATYTEHLAIGSNLRIVGSGAETTIIDGGGTNTVVTISANAHVTLSKLTIQNGSSAYEGGGIFNNGILVINNSIVRGNFAYRGGGIFNHNYLLGSGILAINNSTVTSNLAYSGHSPAFGGGIYNDAGTVTISKSTFSGNVANGPFGFGAGGGILNSYGTVAISNSTFSGNGAGNGGGVGNGGGSVTINNSTLSGNGAGYGGGVSNEGGSVTINNSTVSGNSARPYWAGGVLNNGGTTTLRNSILANNSGGNCVSINSGYNNSNGYNLSSDGTCNFKNTGDLNNTNPKLGPLQNNGGPTQTQALLSGSPAIDSGNPNGCTDGHGNLLKTDQRGQPRPDKEDSGGCDRGAYERQTD
jgi:hypothetical protein